jgi:hypothetical protein
MITVRIQLRHNEFRLPTIPHPAWCGGLPPLARAKPLDIAQGFANCSNQNHAQRAGCSTIFSGLVQGRGPPQPAPPQPGPPQSGPPQSGPPQPGPPPRGPPQPRSPCQPPPFQPSNCRCWTAPGAACGAGAALATPASPMAERPSAPAIAPVPTIFFRVMPIPFSSETLNWNIRCSRTRQNAK